MAEFSVFKLETFDFSKCVLDDADSLDCPLVVVFPLLVWWFSFWFHLFSFVRCFSVSISRLHCFSSPSRRELRKSKASPMLSDAPASNSSRHCSPIDFILFSSMILLRFSVALVFIWSHMWLIVFSLFCWWSMDSLCIGLFWTIRPRKAFCNVYPSLVSNLLFKVGCQPHIAHAATASAAEPLSFVCAEKTPVADKL